MESIFTATNLKTAAIVTIAALLAVNLTADQSALVRGGSMFAAALAGAFIATKF